MAKKSYNNIFNLPQNMMNALAHINETKNERVKEAYIDIARRTYGQDYTNAFRDAWEGVVAPAIIANSPADLIRSKMAYNGGFCPELQFVTFDFLKKEDVPYNIEQNSVYLIFEVDMIAQKVSLHSCGHINISPYDKSLPANRYYCMRSMVEIAEDAGIAKFRKRNFKSAEHLAEIMKDYSDRVMRAVKEYTGGYPYKQGILTTAITKYA